ncbi:TRIO and F-actin-binding protein [Alosa sapidissima]|uniref:TRIO and F-actin-binding protein n=1 Tax=Alosa sapidissima TaxID=34773 RepID=UPI001C09199C|nr:TRIO and F-actin-binding protein [Alosa sapidissima]
MVRRRPQSQSPQRDYQHQPSRSSGMLDGYSAEHRDSEERGRGRERGRDRRERERKHQQRYAGKQPETKLTSSHAETRFTSAAGECDSHHQEKFIQPAQLNILNFKKGWIFRLDDDEEWRKYWFVLANSRLKYYRDSQAEERDELEGEIDVSSCADIVECDVEKNYGFQVHTQESVITLSAMTSRIRRSWVEILRRNIFSDNLPDQCHGSRSEIVGSKANSLDVDQDESNLVRAPLTNQREAGEGRDRDQERRLEDRTRWFQEGVLCSDGVCTRWDTIELKKGTSQATDQLADNIVGESKDIDRKWEVFERLPFGEMKSLCLDGSPNHDSSNEGEVLSPRQRREVLRSGQTEGSSSAGVGGLSAGVGGLSAGVGGPCAGVGGLCGPTAPCVPRLRALEQLYKESLEAAQRDHERRIEELQKEKERLLMKEAQAAAKTMEALRKAHQEELEKAKGLVGREALTESRKPLCEAGELQVELDGLSERYSDKCVELSRIQESSRDTYSEMEHQTVIEHLRKENQELQSRLTEEITLMRAFITGQRSQSQLIFYGSHDHSSSDMEVLLRAKDNEIMYLQKEISCLRNEVVSLMKEKQSVCERFKEVYVELSRVRGASERELGCLREHLNLTIAAVQEQQHMSSST